MLWQSEATEIVLDHLKSMKDLSKEGNTIESLIKLIHFRKDCMRAFFMINSHCDVHLKFFTEHNITSLTDLTHFFRNIGKPPDFRSSSNIKRSLSGRIKSGTNLPRYSLTDTRKEPKPRDVFGTDGQSYLFARHFFLEHWQIRRPMPANIELKWMYDPLPRAEQSITMQRLPRSGASIRGPQFKIPASPAKRASRSPSPAIPNFFLSSPEPGSSGNEQSSSGYSSTLSSPDPTTNNEATYLCGPKSSGSRSEKTSGVPLSSSSKVSSPDSILLKRNSSLIRGAGKLNTVKVDSQPDTNVQESSSNINSGSPGNLYAKVTNPFKASSKLDPCIDSQATESMPQLISGVSICSPDMVQKDQDSPISTASKLSASWTSDEQILDQDLKSDIQVETLSSDDTAVRRRESVLRTPTKRQTVTGTFDRDTNLAMTASDIHKTLKLCHLLTTPPTVQTFSETKHKSSFEVPSYDGMPNKRNYRLLQSPAKPESDIVYSKTDSKELKSFWDILEPSPSKLNALLSCWSTPTSVLSPLEYNTIRSIFEDPVAGNQETDLKDVASSQSSVNKEPKSVKQGLASLPSSRGDGNQVPGSSSQSDAAPRGPRLTGDSTRSKQSSRSDDDDTRSSSVEAVGTSEKMFIKCVKHFGKSVHYQCENLTRVSELNYNDYYNNLCIYLSRARAQCLLYLEEVKILTILVNLIEANASQCDFFEVMFACKIDLPSLIR